MIHGNPIVLAPPEGYPITLEDLKEQCRWTTKEEEELLSSYLATASETAESDLARSLLTQRRALYFDRFPPIIYLRYPPVFEGEDDDEKIILEYLDDTTGEYVVLDRALYEVDLISRRPRIISADDMPWPVHKRALNAIRVTYSAGYGGPEDVPDRIKQAIRLLAATWFKNREQLSNVQVYPIPVGYSFLIAKARLVKV